MSYISIPVKFADSWMEKLLGLLKYAMPVPLVIYTRFGIHTLGMKFSIDIVILDRNNRVVRIKENLAPNRIYIWSMRYRVVLELPGGYVKEKKIHLQDTVKLVEN